MTEDFTNRGRWVATRRSLLLLLLLQLGAFALPRHANAWTAIASAQDTSYFYVSQNFSTSEAAIRDAMRQCTAARPHDTCNWFSFQFSYAAIAIVPGKLNSIAFGYSSEQEAREQAYNLCFPLYGNACVIAQVLHDDTVESPSSTTAVSSSRTFTPDFVALAVAIIAALLASIYFFRRSLLDLSENFSNLVVPLIEKIRRLAKRESALKTGSENGAEQPAATANLPATIEVAELTPLDKVLLKLKRSEKQKWNGAIVFMLDARLDAPAETMQRIAKYSLSQRLVYESAERQQHRANAMAHLTGSRSDVPLLAPAGEQAKGALKTFWKIGRAAVSTTRASLALRVTVASLLRGVHIECYSMEELLDAEEEIRHAARGLKAYVETSKTFDGSEEIVEL